MKWIRSMEILDKAQQDRLAEGEEGLRGGRIDHSFLEVMKPTVYVETTIPSLLTAWPSRDVEFAGQQIATVIVQLLPRSLWRDALRSATPRWSRLW
jgi:hypothetical protein